MKHRADHAEAFEPASQAGGLAVVVGLVVPVRRRGVIEERALGRLGLLVARLLTGRLLDPGAPVVVVVDDTLFRRWGPQGAPRVLDPLRAAQGKRKITEAILPDALDSMVAWGAWSTLAAFS
jgi:hypothetical protein